ncbi:MAG: hypothetical protein WDN75_00775 [Bacteroidota bacterium]
MIKLYREKIKEAAFDTLSEYKIDFLDFIKSNIHHISADYKRDNFYAFCGEAYHTILNKIVNKIEGDSAVIQTLNAADANVYVQNIVSSQLDEYAEMVNGLVKGNHITITFAAYTTFYDAHLTEIIEYVKNEIRAKHASFDFIPNQIEKMKNILFSMIDVEYIFEKNSGLVFIGFGDKEIYPSSQLVTIGTIIADTPRFNIANDVKIVPGISNSNIIPYAQGDVTTTVLTGVDPNYKTEVKNSIETALQVISSEVTSRINDPAESGQVATIIGNTAKELVNKLEDYQFNTITRPLLEILAHMGKEDMAELAESLVNITSLKRKFTSSDSADESVGGPVDVAIITKGDGFVWMKRKHYFDIDLNKGFVNKYYKN